MPRDCFTLAPDGTVLIQAYVSFFGIPDDEVTDEMRYTRLTEETWKQREDDRAALRHPDRHRT